MRGLGRESRTRKKRQRKRRPINVAASVVTTFGMYCGIASIFASINLRFEVAAYWIIGAILVDTLDGAVARLTQSVSDFGKELDSLCDIVSFGVAPAILAYIAFLQGIGPLEGDAAPIASMIPIIFVICGALRLARYNVYQSGRRDYFSGLPIPAAGGTIAAIALFMEYFEIGYRFAIMAPATIGLAALMVSTVRYPRDRVRMFFLSPRRAFRFLVLCVIGIAAFHYASQHSPAIIFMPLAVSYVLFGLGDEIYLRARRRLRRKTEGDLAKETTGAT